MFNAPVSIVGNTSAAWPRRLGVVPGLADGSQDRQLDTELERAHNSSGAAVSTLVLSGLGGVGKTQLAARYAHQVWKLGRVDLLVWVNATSRQAIISSFAQSAVDILAVGDGNTQQGADRFLAWLAETSRRWLIVLDDLQAPSDLTGLWPPEAETGSVLVTTRRHDAALAGVGRRLIDVGLFSVEEAVGYLQYKLPGEEEDQLARLALDLEYLPLAVAQAAAYMRDRGLGCSDYRRRFADRHRKLGDLLPESDALPDDQLASVATTWSLSIEQADERHPIGLARPLLEIASVLDGNGIPETALVSWHTLGYLAHRASTHPAYLNRNGPFNLEQARDALRSLHRLNLVAIDQTDSTPAVVRVHDLVQRATRDQLNATDLGYVVRVAANALTEVWADLEKDPTLGQLLLANATAVTSRQESLWTFRGGHAVLFRTGKILRDFGRVTDVTTHWGQVRDEAESRFGPNHRETLLARAELAVLDGEAGDADEAVELLEGLQEDYRRLLNQNQDSAVSDDDLVQDAMINRYDLITWRARVSLQDGDEDGVRAAVPQLGDLLKDFTHVLGADHPEITTLRHNLAYWRGMSGDHAGTIDDYEKLLADRCKALGPDHPKTLATRHNLAVERSNAGDLDGAIAEYERLVKDFTRIFGPDHPNTLTVRYNLAHSIGEAGDTVNAQRATEELRAHCLEVLDPEHPLHLTVALSPFYRDQILSPRGEQQSVD